MKVVRLETVERNHQMALALKPEVRYAGCVVIERMTMSFPGPNKENLTMPQTLSMQDIARLLQIQSYRIQYAYAHNRLPEPRLRIAGRRLFTLEDLQQLATHFGVTLPAAEAAAEPVAESAGV